MSKIPYIKKELRPPFDTAIGYAIVNQIYNAQDMILFGIKDKDNMTIDGCLNYVFTQLLRKVEFPAKIFLIRNTIRLIFLSPPRYAYLERVIGLLNCMITEFKRRKWNKDAIPEILTILKELKDIYIEYEDDAKEKNGDLE